MKTEEGYNRLIYRCIRQEAFEKCWAHSSQRAASRQFTRCRAPPAHRCPQRRQRQRVTEGTAMAPWNGPNNEYAFGAEQKTLG